MSSRLNVASLLSAALLITACAGDGPGAARPSSDGGGAKATHDGGAVGTGGEAGMPEQHETLPNGCDKQCLAEGDTLCAFDSASKSCVECMTDAHCQGNPGALGPKCDPAQGICVCASNAECATNSRGKTCNTTAQMCTCAAASECKSPFTLCYGGDAATQYCQKPCTASTDCPSGTSCLTSTGQCVECTTDAECAAQGYSACDTTKHTCRECKTDADCKALDFGADFCDTAQGLCVECKTATECAASKYGAVCDKGLCGCNTDADCAKTTTKKCDTTQKYCKQ